MDLAGKIRKALAELQVYGSYYEQAKEDAKAGLLPSHDLLDVALDRKGASLPIGFEWLGHHLMRGSSNNREWVDPVIEIAKESERARAFVELVAEGQLMPQGVAYRLGYIQGMCNLNEKVVNEMGYALLNQDIHLEHQLKTQEGVNTFCIGLRGEPLDEKFSAERLADHLFEFDLNLRDTLKTGPIIAYQNGLNIAIWRDFRYVIHDGHNILNPEAFESFRRGMIDEPPLNNVNGPYYQCRMNKEVYSWGKDISQHMKKCNAVFMSRVNILRRECGEIVACEYRKKFEKRFVPLGFKGIDTDRAYGKKVERAAIA